MENTPEPTAPQPVPENSTVERTESKLQDAVTVTQIAKPEDKVGAIEVEGKRPWDQQEGEADQHYILFLMYKDMGMSRTLNDVYRMKRGVADSESSKDIVASGSMQQVSAQWKWVDRAKAYDNWMARRESEAYQNMREQLIKASEEAMLNITQSIRDVTKSGADWQLPELKKKLAVVMAMCGKGRGGDFIINSHRAIAGDKHVVEAKQSWVDQVEF